MIKPCKIIFGDDIGQSNISAYSRGLMGFMTPNIDRIDAEGGVFVQYYGQQSCTAGRAAFITGQCPFRTGLTKVGLPGSPIGLEKEDPTIAEFLKPLGCMCGQYGKHHLGDRDQFLPSAHGFDEFFGNLYRPNAEQEPENEDYPKDPEFKKKYGPRGVLRSSADGRIEDTGNEGGKGDIAMLTFSQAGKYPSLQLLVNDDDEAREFLYSEPDSASLKAVAAAKWTVISMKSDWKEIFSNKPHL